MERPAVENGVGVECPLTCGHSKTDLREKYQQFAAVFIRDLKGMLAGDVEDIMQDIVLENVKKREAVMEQKRQLFLKEKVGSEKAHILDIQEEARMMTLDIIQNIMAKKNQCPDDDLRAPSTARAERG